MDKQETILVHNIQLNTSQPTALTFTQLYDWVIWQFAEPTETSLTGAVRPPITDANWYPALILPKEKRVQIYGHLDSSFNTPEKASNWFLKQPLSV